MTEPTVTIAKPASAVERLLFFGWWSVMALLPIGHVTGLRNTWTTLVVVATLVWLGRDAWHGLPGRKTMLLLLAWCAMTIGWSTVPEVSFGKWRSDLLLPLLAYVAAHGYVIRSGSCRPIVGGIMTGIAMLMLLSLAVFVPASLVPAVSHLLPFESFANLASPLPVWYPGVGDASMAASLAAALLVGAPRLLPDIRRAWWVAGWVAIAVVVLVSNNRNAALAIPFVVAVAFLLMRRTTAPLRPMRWKRWILAGTAVLVVATALVAMMESSARERLRIIGAPVRSDQSALVVLTERDTRPMIWAYYTRLALRAPIVGVGFGRTVPGIHYRTQDDRDLARVEFNAYIHAHNLFLDWWLQTGAIGVALLVGLLCVIVGHAHRLARSATGVEAKAALVMLHALIALMLIRDATDDFLVYGMATLFWALLGCIGASVGAARDPVVSARRDP